MKENKVKAIGILKIVLRILNVIIFVASVIGIARILMPKKKATEETDVSEEVDDFNDYIEDVDLSDYEFDDEKDNESDDEENDDEDEEYDEDEDLPDANELLKGAKGWEEDL